ncbi:hypothetical protein DIPPA_16965, partial [Diplonema papillatum]
VEEAEATRKATLKPLEAGRAGTASSRDGWRCAPPRAAPSEPYRQRQQSMGTRRDPLGVEDTPSSSVVPPLPPVVPTPKPQRHLPQQQQLQNQQPQLQQRQKPHQQQPQGQQQQPQQPQPQQQKLHPLQRHQQPQRQRQQHRTQRQLPQKQQQHQRPQQQQRQQQRRLRPQQRQLPDRCRRTPRGPALPTCTPHHTTSEGPTAVAAPRRRRLARGCSCLGSSGRSHNSNSSTNDSGSSLTGSSSDSPNSSGNNGPDSGGNTSTSSSTCRSNSSPRSSSHNSSNGKGPYSGSPSPSSRSHNSRSSNCLNGSSPSTRSSGTSSRSINGSCFSFSPPPALGQQSSGIIPRGPGLLERLSRVPELGPRAPWRRLGGRETQQWGFAFRQGGLPLKLEEGIPEGPLKEMADLIRVRLGWVPDQLLVNRYGRGVGIAPHTDQRALGPTVATVSLLSDTVMEWEKGGRKVRTPLPVGTLCHMEGEARCLWTHGIRPADVTQPRVSLTYRSVRGGARSLSHDPPQPSADAPSHPTVGAPRTKRPTDRAQGLLPGKPGRNEEEEHDQGGATDAERDQGRPPQREERDRDAPPRAPPASLAPQPREARPWRWEDEWGPEWVPGDAPLARGRPARLPKTGGTKGGDRRRSPLPTYPPKPRPKKLRPTPSKEERRVKAGRRREARAKRREEEGQQPRSPSPAPRKEDEGDPPTTKGRWWARNKRRREGGRRKTRPHKKRREGLRRPAPPEEDEETPVSCPQGRGAPPRRAGGWKKGPSPGLGVWGLVVLCGAFCLGQATPRPQGVVRGRWGAQPSTDDGEPTPTPEARHTPRPPMKEGGGRGRAAPWPLPPEGGQDPDTGGAPVSGAW